MSESKEQTALDTVTAHISKLMSDLDDKGVDSSPLGEAYVAALELYGTHLQSIVDMKLEIDKLKIEVQTLKQRSLS